MPSRRPLLQIPESQRARELRAANLRADQERAWHRDVRNVFVQCFILMLLGVPLYGLAWHLTDSRQSSLAAAGAMFVSYALPLLRLLVFHVRATERGDY